MRWTLDRLWGNDAERTARRTVDGIEVAEFVDYEERSVRDGKYDGCKM
ncbi:MAG: hypothetical protein ACYS76_15040 [Planctomycetota bacterium]|jgi:hypothetical protein